MVRFSLFNAVTSYEKDLQEQKTASGKPLGQWSPRWTSSPPHAGASDSEEGTRDKIPANKGRAPKL